MFLSIIQLCIVAYGLGKSYLLGKSEGMSVNYPLLGWLLGGVKIPANVDRRTRSTSDAFERVGFADRQWLFRAVDQHPQWPNWKCEMLKW